MAGFFYFEIIWLPAWHSAIQKQLSINYKLYQRMAEFSISYWVSETKRYQAIWIENGFPINWAFDVILPRWKVTIIAQLIRDEVFQVFSEKLWLLFVIRAICLLKDEVKLYLILRWRERHRNFTGSADICIALVRLRRAFYLQKHTYVFWNPNWSSFYFG